MVSGLSRKSAHGWRDRNYSHQLVSWHGVCRDLEGGKQVVVDVGIRTIRKRIAGTATPRIQLYVSWGFQ